MSDSNRATLAQLDKMTAEGLAGLLQDQIAMLVEDLADAKDTLAKRDAKLFKELDRRFGLLAHNARREQGKDTGTVRFMSEDREIIADLQKKPEWCPKKLALIQTIIKDDWKSNPDEYIETKLSVAESKYKAWPSDLRALFDPARTLKTGKPTYKFAEVKE